MTGIPKDIRDRFPATRDGVYLATSARGLIPREVHRAVAADLDARLNGTTDKAEMFAAVENARAGLARLINAEPDEIAITKNVSEGLNAIASALPWAAGDNVVMCSEVEHPNNLYPWLNLRARLGIEVRDLPADGGHVPVAKMIHAMDERTRAVTVASMSFTPGFRTDLATLGRACRERGIFLLVDAVQSTGILHTDVEALAIDGLATSTSKGLLGLYGMGFLYCRRAWAEKLTPVYLARFGVDLGDISEAEKGGDNYRLMAGARRFDVGNYNYPGAVAAEAALDLLNGIGTEAIEAYVVDLAHRLARGLLDLGLPVVGGAPGAHTGSIVCVGRRGEAAGHGKTDDPEMASLAAHLEAGGITFTIRLGLLRFALHLYNDQADVDRVLELVAEWQAERDEAA